MERKGSPETPSSMIPRGRLGLSFWAWAWALPASEQSEQSSFRRWGARQERGWARLQSLGKDSQRSRKFGQCHFGRQVRGRKPARGASSQGQGQSLRPVYKLDERMLAQHDSSSLVSPTISHSETNLLALRRATQENRIKLTYLERPIPAAK